MAITKLFFSCSQSVKCSNYRGFIPQGTNNKCSYYRGSNYIAFSMRVYQGILKGLQKFVPFSERSNYTDSNQRELTVFHFPKACRLAKLKPLYKKDTERGPKISKPILVLPLVSKIIKKVIHDQTMDSLTENKIIKFL